MTIQQPQSLEEVTGVELALDDYIKGVHQAVCTLEAIDKMRHELYTRDSDIALEAFNIIQSFVRHNQSYLKVPVSKVVTLEYYNNRPLKELALESLEGFIAVIVEGVKATFRFILDCLKAIFGISSKAKEDASQADIKYLEENYQQIGESLAKRKDKDGNVVTVYKHSKAKRFGVGGRSVKVNDIAKALQGSIASLKAIKSVPGALEALVKETLTLAKQMDDQSQDAGYQQKLSEVSEKMGKLLSNLPSTPANLSQYSSFKNETKVVAFTIVEDYEVIEITQEDKESPSKIKYKRVKNEGLDTSVEVDAFIFKVMDSLITRLKQLNTEVGNFVAEVEGSNKNTKGYGEQLTTLLETAAKKKGEAIKANSVVYKSIKDISAGLLNYTNLFAAIYKEVDRLRVDTISVLANK